MQVEIINGMIKWIAQRPRPFFMYPDVRVLKYGSEPNFTFPSSHSQILSYIGLGTILMSDRFKWWHIFTTVTLVYKHKETIFF